ncbi:MAG: UDP-2,4-diacetamido-2,4,6-trideoxy-beta-L-altropyranose hydrolase [Prevotella sp.]|nr:UDP-2,4-diacetamido-2,4,6-trideoxy-beta-L-altropyranose hydrolase [Prevotella sp.]
MIIFRADANKQIASGHIMRCVSIAQTFVEAGEDVLFAVADESPVSMLNQAGVKYTVLHSQWNYLKGEIGQMTDLLQQHDRPTLLIDTYQVTRQYAEAMMPYAKVCYLGSKPEYLGALKALVNYSTDIDYDFYQSNYSEETKLLLGASYAPLRKEFLQVRHEERTDGRCGVLLTTGNTDPRGCVAKILERLEQDGLLDALELHVVIGAMFENKAELHRRYDNNPNVVLHENVKRMSELMSVSDLAISANGTTVYELAAAKVPAVTFAMVEEQKKSGRKLAELDVVYYCGEMYEDVELCIAQISQQVKRLTEDAEERLRLLEKANSVVDGRGCDRIVESLKQL